MRALVDGNMRVGFGFRCNLLVGVLLSVRVMPLKWRTVLKLVLGLFFAFSFIAPLFPGIRSVIFPYIGWFHVFSVVLILIAYYDPKYRRNPLGRLGFTKLKLNSKISDTDKFKAETRVR